MSDQMLMRCLAEAEQRKNDATLPVDVRIRSWETYALCLREASVRGLVP